VTILRLSQRELAERLADLPVHRPWGLPGEGIVVLVAPDGDAVAPPIPATTAAVVVALADHVEDPWAAPTPEWADVCLPITSDLVTPLIDLVERQPISTLALAQVLRGSEHRTIDEGLLLESAVYSTLQAGTEFRRWIAERRRPERPVDAGDRVRVERIDDRLRITLDRASARNALDARMRDALLDALDLAVADPSLSEVLLEADGVDFCAGGDLDEFGSASDPASAHLLRTEYSIGPRLARLGDRLEVHVHGACIGSGLELPAFAARIVSEDDARFALPEVTMGLIPGAGGTWSIPRRIGRHRTATLALTGTSIDAATARRIGLVDR